MFDFIVGVDEAGRGPLAGPVSVGAVAVSAAQLPRIVGHTFRGVRESKQLTPHARDVWLAALVASSGAGQIAIHYTFSGERMIDRDGIVRATGSAIARTLSALCLDPSRTLVLLDGGLKAPKHFPHQKTIIRGDEKEPLIALASIVAKAHRDRKMIRLAKRHPEYGFDRHKGYGTRLHFKRIAEHGLCTAHRRSFCKKIHNATMD